MKLSLRGRIVLTLVPLLALLAGLGAAGIVLLQRLGGRADAILRENYDSVKYMERLGEALERIDSAFLFALLGDRERQARDQYEEHWKHFRYYLDRQRGNITLPREQEQTDRLAALSDAYRREGDAFFARGDLSARKAAYFGAGGTPGLLDRFKQLKDASGAILRMNQTHMEQTSREARETASASLFWFAAALAGVAAVGAALAVRTARALLEPIRAVTASAIAIGAGDLDQLVPVVADDELGQLAGAFNTMAHQLRDYRRSQQAAIVRAQQTSQATVDAFPHPVLVVDHEGRVETANPAARRLLGVAPDARALPWQPPEPLRQPLGDALLHQRDYLPHGFDHTFPLRAGGEELVVLPRVLTIRDAAGRTLGAAVLLEDVTRFRLLDQVKSNLVATVSHELKTPLTGIRLAVHLLIEEAVGPLTPKQLELLLDARDNTERLLTMINNLLDLARLEGGRPWLQMRPEAPDRLMSAAAEALRPRADEKGVVLVVEAPPGLPPVAADADKLGHALHNLLDNALRYTDAGGRVTLSARAADGAVTLSVADTGAGIPPEHLPHVFDRFFRVPGQSQPGGSGLGLAIVREIVTAHGGSVTCDSGSGRGTRFDITLPAWKGGTDER
jgi:signal transduction histidine kinase